MREFDNITSALLSLVKNILKKHSIETKLIT